MESRGESNPFALMALAAVRADPVSAVFLAPRAPAVVLADSFPTAHVVRIALAVVLADPFPAALSALWPGAEWWSPRHSAWHSTVRKHSVNRRPCKKEDMSEEEVAIDAMCK